MTSICRMKKNEEKWGKKKNLTVWRLEIKLYNFKMSRLSIIFGKYFFPQWVLVNIDRKNDSWILVCWVFNRDKYWSDWTILVKNKNKTNLQTNRKLALIIHTIYKVNGKQITDLNVKCKAGVPNVAQWKRIWLAPMRMQVQSLALLSGLRIQHCRKLWYRLQTRLGSGVAVAVV